MSGSATIASQKPYKAVAKTYLPSAVLVVLAGVVVGAAGLLLTPAMFAAAVVGSILMAIALAKTEFALALLVIVAPLTNASVNLGPIPLNAVTICSGLAIISYAIHNLGKKTDAKPMPFTWSFIAFLFVCTVSMVVAPSIVDSLAVIIRFAGYFLMIFVIGRSIRTRNTLTWILVLMVVAGALTGLYGLYQYFFAPQTAKIGLYDLTDDVAGRIGSTFENPNFYAEYLVLMVPIGLALVLGSRGLFRRFAMSIATLLLFAGLMMTYTRGSWLSTGIGIALMSILTEAWLIWVWVGLFAVALIAAPGVASRFASITDTTGGTAGFRRRLWTIALGIIAEHKLLGAGIGNYYDVFTEYIFRHPELSVGWVIYGAHNSYLTIWAETGIFGILSFVAIILVSIRYGLYLSREKSGDKYLSWINSAIFAGVVGFALNSLTSNSFHHPQGAVFFWFALGLQLAIDNLQPEQAPESKSSMLQESILLRPFVRIGAVLRSAAASHFTNAIFTGIRMRWHASAMGTAVNWLYKEPSRPDIFGNSRIWAPVTNISTKTRAALDASQIFAVIKGTAQKPVVSVSVFAITAIVARLIASAVIG
jgi:O-antigen ligase